MAKLQHEFEEELNEDGELVIKVNPLDYIMSRLWDSGKFKNKQWIKDGRFFEAPSITYDDLREELNNILCFDNMEGVDDAES